MEKPASGGSDEQRQVLVNRLTRRAWLDEEFRQLLVDDPQGAVRAEFGEIPESLAGLTIQSAPVDRATMRRTQGRQTLHLRPKASGRPISAVLRHFLGERELIVVLYTRRCAYACSFCTLPSAGAVTDVRSTEIAAQLQTVADFIRAEQADGIARVAVGNEGSLLDKRTLPEEQLGMVMDMACHVPGAKEIIIETRPEFVTPAMLNRIDALRGDCAVTVKVGLESSDEHIREDILGKRMPLSVFTDAVRVAGKFGYGLESYVLLKAHPYHSDAEAREEAIKTCEYVKQVCADYAVPLTLRINSMYMAAGSRWATVAAAAGWSPPSVFDIAEVMNAVRTDHVRVFAGLSEEGLATPNGHFIAREDFASWALAALEHYNATGDVDCLLKVVRNAGRDRDKAR